MEAAKHEVTGIGSQAGICLPCGPAERNLGGVDMSVIIRRLDRCCSLPAGLCMSTEAKEYKLYYLGGQSNMDGLGSVKDLKDKDAHPVKDVMIFHGNPGLDGKPADGRGIWAELRPGHGSGFSSDGKTNSYSDCFGVELSFGRRLQELDPGTNIAIIKYSRGATALSANANDAKVPNYGGSWEPDFKPGSQPPENINQYDHFLATLENAFAVLDVNGDGEPNRFTPSGIIWMQGESDAHQEPVARQYEVNLKRMMDLMREAFGSDNLPVVIGRISDSGQHPTKGKVWDFGEIVRQAQAEFVKKDRRAALVTSTDDYRYVDPYHYDSAALLDLGRKFAEAVHALNGGKK